MWHVSRDGVVLAYAARGQGLAPLLFLHGALGDHSHFAAQLEHFGRVRRVVAPDFRGHGESDKPEQEYTIACLADDVVWLCRQLAIRKPVLVGHSLGGVVALDVASRYPDLPAGIVLLDAPVQGSQALATSAGLQDFLAALRTPAYRDAVRTFMTGTFLPTDDDERGRRLLEAMCAAPQHVAASVLAHCFQYDLAAAAPIRIPALYIHAAGVTDLVTLRAVCPQLITGQTVGAGHFLHLEVPDQVNAMLEQFLIVAGLDLG